MPTYKTKKGDNIKTIKPISRTGQKLLGMKNVRKGSTAKKAGGSMKKKGYAMGGAMKKKGMSKGGKLKMVEKDGKKVPFFAADGKGKMAGGGMMKKKGYAKGGAVKVKSGDTLSQIAKKKGVTLKALLAANPSIKNANMIRVGQSIKIPGARTIGRGSKSKNPYAGMSQTQMNQLRSKDKATQRAGTSGMRAQVKSGGSPTTPNAKKAATVKASKDGTASAMEKARARRAAAKKAPPKKTAPKPTAKPGFGARLLDAIKPNRPGSAKMAAGGKMKKKGYKKGGTVRGAGAATRGKRFGRSA